MVEILLALVVVMLACIAGLLYFNLRELRNPPAPKQAASPVRAPQYTVPWPLLAGSALSDENTANTIEEWKAERDSHPEGSPKWQAFDNRLRDLGAA